MSALSAGGLLARRDEGA